MGINWDTFVLPTEKRRSQEKAVEQRKSFIGPVRSTGGSQFETEVSQIRDVGREPIPMAKPKTKSFGQALTQTLKNRGKQYGQRLNWVYQNLSVLPGSKTLTDLERTVKADRETDIVARQEADRKGQKNVSFSDYLQARRKQEAEDPGLKEARQNSILFIGTLPEPLRAVSTATQKLIRIAQSTDPDEIAQEIIDIVPDHQIPPLAKQLARAQNTKEVKSIIEERVRANAMMNPKPKPLPKGISRDTNIPAARGIKPIPTIDSLNAPGVARKAAAQAQMDEITNAPKNLPTGAKLELEGGESPLLLGPANRKAGEGFTMSDTVDQRGVAISKSALAYREAIDRYNMNPTPVTLKKVQDARAAYQATVKPVETPLAPKPTTEIPKTTPIKSPKTVVENPKPVKSAKVAPTAKEVTPVKKVVSETPKPISPKPVTNKSDIVKQSKQAKRVASRIAEDYEQSDINYNQLDLEKDAANGVRFVEQHPERAKRIVAGREGVPGGISETAIRKAYEASIEGTPEHWKTVVTNSLRATRIGQEIAALRPWVNAHDPSLYIRDVLAPRLKRIADTEIVYTNKVYKKGASETGLAKVRQEVTTIKKALGDDAVKRAQRIIDSLICK